MAAYNEEQAHDGYSGGFVDFNFFLRPVAHVHRRGLGERLVLHA